MRRGMPQRNQFQFTPLREGRPAPHGDNCPRRNISIHAPPRGATRYHRQDSSGGLFQFTPLREGRPALTSRRTSKSYFNSRPSARGDRLRGCAFSAQRYFNSRPSARGDEEPMNYKKQDIISIHAPPRGATRAGKRAGKATDIFQFTPLREGRRCRCCQSRGNSYFNSRPSARGDAGYPGNSPRKTISIHAPPRGATRSR